MKIIKKKVKSCENTWWVKTTVLDLIYSHRGKEWRILVKDYFDSEENFNDILKQLRVKVRELYNKEKLKA